MTGGKKGGARFTHTHFGLGLLGSSVNTGTDTDADTDTDTDTDTRVSPVPSLGPKGKRRATFGPVRASTAALGGDVLSVSHHPPTPGFAERGGRGTSKVRCDTAVRGGNCVSLLTCEHVPTCSTLRRKVLEDGAADGGKFRDVSQESHFFAHAIFATVDIHLSFLSLTASELGKARVFWDPWTMCASSSSSQVTPVPFDGESQSGERG